MARESKEKCTELQLIFHIAVAFGLGALIGGSLFGGNSKLESELLTQSTDMRKDFASALSDFKENIKVFDEKFKHFHARAVFGIQSQCTDLTNYFIDGSEDVMKVQFAEPFHSKPVVYTSINGFLYSPLIVKKDGVQEFLSFEITEVNEIGFGLTISSSEKFDFSKTHFDRIDLCYLAFLNA